MKRIVIIGGMGPQASIDLHQRIIAGAASLGARNNQDYPLIVHASIPVKDFINSSEINDAKRLIKQQLKSLSLTKEDKVIIACNTAHLLKSELEHFSGVNFVSLIDKTLKMIFNNTEKNIGLIASPTTISSGLYTNRLKQKGCSVILCNKRELNIVERCIRRIIANEDPAQYKEVLDPIIEMLKARGAKKIILGCTELSLVYKHSNHAVIIDPLEIMANYLINQKK